MAYMIEDTYQLVVTTKGVNSFMKQTLVHHIAIVFAFSCGLLSGFAYPALSCLFLVAELSSIILNYSYMFTDKKEKLSTLSILYKVFFFTTFILLRIVGWPYLQYLVVYNFRFSWPIINGARRFTSIITVTLAGAMMLLNIFWFYLIIKTITKMFKGEKLKKYVDDDYIKSENALTGHDQESKA